MDKVVETFYDSFAESQLKAGVHRRHLYIFQWLKKFGLKSHHDVLEIGCGVGTVTGLVLELVNKGKVMASDISPESISIARNRLRRYSNVEFITGDILDSKLDGQFDFVFLPDVLEHIPQVQHTRLFHKIDEVLRPGGTVFIHMPEPFFQEWLHRYQKNLLQVIDQPVHTKDLLNSIEGTSLRLEFLCTYSIWLKDPEFQAIALRKTRGLYGYTENLPLTDSHWSRAVNKLRKWIGKPTIMLPS